MAQFDSKSFNEKAFKYSVERVPNMKMNELKKSRVLAGNTDIDNAFTTQNGTAYARIAFKGLADGEAVNYDGQTDITASRTKTYEQGVVVVGRAKAWVESDFSYDITGGVDFMENVAQQVAEYKDGLDQETILAILDGIFAMNTGAKNKEFVQKHTFVTDGNMTATTLNTATNKACGANKKKFALVFMHSDVSTNLENLNLIEHLKFTDKNGVQRELDLGTWNGKLVVIDDYMPIKVVTAHYERAEASDEGALKVVENSATAGEINKADVTADISDIAANEYVVLVGEYTEYTSYCLGEGSFSYKDVGAKVPYEMSRDPKTNGGEDTLYTRQRKIFSPRGISYEKAVQASLSPTDEELANGKNWSLVCSGETRETDRTYIDHRAIAICKIVSRG